MERTFTIRWLTPDSAEADAPELLRLIRGLAQYEGWARAIDITAGDLIRRAQLPEPPFRAALAEATSGAPKNKGSSVTLVGMATVFVTNYTFAQKPSLELEMLFVDGDWRSHGVGAAIMDQVFLHAQGGGYTKLEWNVLNTNARAQKFYAQMGGKHQVQWERWGLAL